jgi:hypothetical protein
MKKLLVLLFVAFALNANAQYLTSFAKNINTAETDGFYYHLPRNIIKVDFTIEKIQDIKGKYSLFTKELLNTDDYIKENRTTYFIKSVSVNAFTESDPNMTFFISPVFDEKGRENINLNIEINSEGILQSFGHSANLTETGYNTFMENHFQSNIHNSEYHYIPMQADEDDEDEEIDESVSDTKLTEEEIALTIIEEIKNLRKAYFDLITGYQEVNYGNSIEYMAKQIKELENEYITMFLGKSYSQTYTQTFYVIPEDGKNSITLSKFSETEGFNNKSGETIKIYFSDISVSSNVNKLSKENIESITYANRLFYRNPANVTMQILFGEKKILENRLKISQLGTVSLIPINKMKLTFDTNTGQILSIFKD